MSYLMGSAFAKVGQSPPAQNATLYGLRTFDASDPTGPFLYSEPISNPTIGSTGFLFGVA